MTGAETSTGPATVSGLSAVEDPERLAVLERTGLLQAAGSATYDRYARIASALLDVPVSFVTLVGLDEQVLAGAWRGDEPYSGRRRMPLRESFCQFSVATREPLVINDTRSDP
ncbi:MAG TPA: hypothetical protein VM367_07235 [Pseudonocardia sp.]|jgi:GAF domain-containing protein|nr:hypothetical protein [Pseudonocardia sp.]